MFLIFIVLLAFAFYTRRGTGINQRPRDPTARAAQRARSSFPESPRVSPSTSLPAFATAPVNRDPQHSNRGGRHGRAGSSR
jgi:hypothetical protein